MIVSATMQKAGHYHHSHFRKPPQKSCFQVASPPLVQPHFPVGLSLCWSSREQPVQTAWLMVPFGVVGRQQWEWGFSATKSFLCIEPIPILKLLLNYYYYLRVCLQGQRESFKKFLSNNPSAVVWLIYQCSAVSPWLMRCVCVCVCLCAIASIDKDSTWIEG